MIIKIIISKSIRGGLLTKEELSGILVTAIRIVEDNNALVFMREDKCASSNPAVKYAFK